MRLRPLPLLGIAVVWAVLVALGTWQVGRAREKERLLAELERAQAQPVAEMERCPPAGAELSPGRVQGSFLAEHQWLLDNRIRGGRAGYDVLTPLVLPSGQAVLVNRGWIALPDRRDEPPRAAPPEGPVALRGHWRAPEHNPFVPRREPERIGAFWRSARVDLHQVSARVRRPVCRLVLLLDADQPHGYVRGWPLMTFGPQRHYGYAVQWYGLALALAGLMVYAWRRR